jgi:hypothetical protein
MHHKDRHEILIKHKKFITQFLLGFLASLELDRLPPAFENFPFFEAFEETNLLHLIVLLSLYQPFF